MKSDRRSGTLSIVFSKKVMASLALKVLGLIPAQGGSKGIANKNIVPLAGKPLIAWTIEAARASSLDRVVLSSDDPAIIETARQIGSVEVPFVRPAALAGDASPMIDTILHAVEWLRDHDNYLPDAVMLLQPTSPLRRAAHMNEASALFDARQADSLVSVVKAPHNMIPESLMRLNPSGWLEPLVPMDERKHTRQLKPAYYARNGAAIYMVRNDILLGQRTLYGARIAAYEMDRAESVDIDDAFDLALCGWILAQREDE